MVNIGRGKPLLFKFKFKLGNKNMARLYHKDTASVSIEGVEYVGKRGVFNVPDHMVLSLIESHGFTNAPNAEEPAVESESAADAEAETNSEGLTTTDNADVSDNSDVSDEAADAEAEGKKNRKFGK